MRLCRTINKIRWEELPQILLCEPSLWVGYLLGMGATGFFRFLNKIFTLKVEKESD